MRIGLVADGGQPADVLDKLEDDSTLAGVEVESATGTRPMAPWRRRGNSSSAVTHPPVTTANRPVASHPSPDGRDVLLSTPA